MKKILSVIIFASCFFILSKDVIAQKSSPTPFPTKIGTETKKADVINDLKERIASRVAQLKLVERKGTIGTVTDVQDTQITISDIHTNTKFIDVDEITKFSSPSSKDSFGISDIPKGTQLGILGLYNKQSRRVLARFVDVLKLPQFIHGQITSVDAKNYSFEVTTDDQKTFTVDVETITRTLLYTSGDGLTKSGFSKIKQGERVITVGYPDIKNKKEIIASRIMLFPEIGRNPNIMLPQNALNPVETIIPSTGSGKKLTPITK